LSTLLNSILGEKGEKNLIDEMSMGSKVMSIEQRGYLGVIRSKHYRIFNTECGFTKLINLVFTKHVKSQGQNPRAILGLQL